ncbi:uncharacterized protein LOC123507591 [Portunus trituberculatus]|uniref:Uncharacterized protein n=1 Tax=Portunus trituberculatus TaxID=210409 RepID=A0A5B7CE79_PORTR|nr:uncharacterized protein LOC123507591 [Portunus trituberculatus]MPC07520.1 hypothetical protein [Portunus trituberculatus]
MEPQCSDCDSGPFEFYHRYTGNARRRNNDLTVEANREVFRSKCHFICVGAAAILCLTGAKGRRMAGHRHRMAWRTKAQRCVTYPQEHVIFLQGGTQVTPFLLKGQTLQLD